jgi:hypothetical protein
MLSIAFSSEVDTGSCKENASKQKVRASVLIQSEPIRDLRLPNSWRFFFGLQAHLVPHLEAPNSAIF